MVGRCCHYEETPNLKWFSNFFSLWVCILLQIKTNHSKQQPRPTIMYSEVLQHDSPIYEKAATSPFEILKLDKVNDDFKADEHVFLGANRLGSHQKHFFTILKIESKIKGIMHFENLKNDPELTLLCCNICEANVSKKYKSKLCKKTIVVEALLKCFELNETEVDQICLMIDHFHATSLIQAPSTTHKVKRYIRKYIEHHFSI